MFTLHDEPTCAVCCSKIIEEERTTPIYVYTFEKNPIYDHPAHFMLCGDICDEKFHEFFPEDNPEFMDYECQLYQYDPPVRA